MTTVEYSNRGGMFRLKGGRSCVGWEGTEPGRDLVRGGIHAGLYPPRNPCRMPGSEMDSGAGYRYLGRRAYGRGSSRPPTA